ncbi:hypothetical protein CXG81DRAFT_19201 [Caulochytrium protostelioides]|uniref:Uncharacterized protein n=1 Tax=Caulochytrium protostelioides TaxID=1555241 RepID=A0A4P9X6W2_9FUNG|nr:hypothetical protein CXG81DRAFT_19201 [Caulochytrium protostelioides]|eukprot:RKP00928.1 hypothetical protein CXG81DRAFT_19201 [Caulochytrium protostelioides]
MPAPDRTPVKPWGPGRPAPRTPAAVAAAAAADPATTDAADPAAAAPPAHGAAAAWRDRVRSDYRERVRSSRAQQIQSRRQIGAAFRGPAADAGPAGSAAEALAIPDAAAPRAHEQAADDALRRMMEAELRAVLADAQARGTLSLDEAMMMEHELRAETAAFWEEEPPMPDDAVAAGATGAAGDVVAPEETVCMCCGRGFLRVRYPLPTPPSSSHGAASASDPAPSNRMIECDACPMRITIPPHGTLYATLADMDDRIRQHT